MVCQSHPECEQRTCHSTKFQPHAGWVTITSVYNSNPQHRYTSQVLARRGEWLVPRASAQPQRLGIAQTGSKIEAHELLRRSHSHK